MHIADVTGTAATETFTITPNLLNVDRAFCFANFRPAGPQNHDGTWKAAEITSTSLLTIFNGGTAVSLDFDAYIVEFDAASDIRTQVGTLGEINGVAPPYNAGTTPPTSTLTAVTLAETMEWNNGHAHQGTDTTIGQEEFCKTRLLTTTTWEQAQTVQPNSGQNVQRFAVADWNDSNVFVQRGINSFVATSNTDTLVGGGTDFTTVDFTRSMFMIEGFSQEPNFSIPTDETFLSAIPNGDDIDLSRFANGGNSVTYNWVIVEFPADFASVQFLTHTMGAATTSNSDTITTLTDFTNALPITTSNSGAFGWGWGRPTAALTAAGEVAQVGVTMDLSSNTNVNFDRVTGTTAIEITYQVVEFLEAAVGRPFERPVNPGAII